MFIMAQGARAVLYIGLKKRLLDSVCLFIVYYVFLGMLDLIPIHEVIDMKYYFLLHKKNCKVLTSLVTVIYTDEKGRR